MLDAAAGYSPATARAAVSRLSSAIFSAIERLERAVSFTLPSASADSLAELVLLDTMSEVRDRFSRLLAEIAALMESHQGQRTSAQVDRVDSFIAMASADPNLSLELIADRLGLSPGHIGRVYRKMRGKSVAETINDARVEAARAKLEDTDATIENIASEIGITNPGSFYRLFKARYGLTPADYRERARFAVAGCGGPRKG
jgi:two-component system response regulator YesN